MANSDEDDKSKNRNEEKPFEWTEGKLRELFTFLSSLLDKFIAFKREEYAADQKYMETTSHHDRRVLYLMIGFLSIIVVSMSVLAYVGRVSSDALLFLVGTATGYVFAFVEKFVFGPPVVKIEPSE